MESMREELARQLRDAERAEVASWTQDAAGPAWWPAVFALWAAVFALTLGYLEGSTAALAEGVLVLVMLGLTWVERRRRGTYPAGRAPREFTPAFTLLFAGAALVGAVAWLVDSTVTTWAAAAVAAAGAYGVLVSYRRAYAAVVARIHARLS